MKIKANDNVSWHSSCLGSVLKDFTKYEQSLISLNGTVYDFLVDYSSIKEEDIPNPNQTRQRNDFLVYFAL